jgi:hypothetical protein
MYFDKDSREIFIYSDIGQGFDWMSGESCLMLNQSLMP